MKKRVVVLGSTGMLGHEVFSKLCSSPTLDVLGTYYSKEPSEKTHHKKFDVLTSTNAELIALVQGAHYVINCIAVLKSDIDETNPESVKRAYEVNTNFPKRLTEAAKQFGAKIFHVSTDGVFSGNSESPLSEGTTPKPNDVYGKSKLEGEISGNNVINIRTSIIGRDPYHHRGLLEWLLKQTDGSEVSGFDDIWHGVTNSQLAHLIFCVIENDCFSKISEESPVHHFCPNQPISKADLLGIFKKTCNKDVTIKPVVRPNGKINRQLATCFKTLLSCYDGKVDIESAVLDLK